MEFLRRVIDFPRRNVIDPFHPSPNFAELVNSRLARAYGATVSLPKGVYFDLEPVGSAKRPHKQGTGIKMATRRTVYRTRGKTDNTAPTAQDNGQTNQRAEFPNRPPTYNVRNPNTYCGADRQPLSGSNVTKILEANAPEALTDSQTKLPERLCCFCWNWNKPCKILDQSGKCTKLHICFHENCRTLHHHTHTMRQHVASVF